MDHASSPQPPLPTLFSLTIPKQQYQKKKKSIETSYKNFLNTSACFHSCILLLS